MKTLRCFNADAPGAGLRKGNLLSIGSRLACFILTVLIALGSNMNLAAQSADTVWKDMGAFKLGYQLSTTADSLYPNEHFSINLYLDVPADTNVDSQDQIDTSRLPAGMYLFEIADESSGRRSVIRVLKR